MLIDHILDAILNNLSHPFFMVIFSIALTFGVKWSVKKSKFDSKFRFFQDQKDEMVVTLILGLMLLIWDDELITAWLFLEAYFKGEEYDHAPQEFHTFYYFLVGPAGDRIIWLYQKIVS